MIKPVENQDIDRNMKANSNQRIGKRFKRVFVILLIALIPLFGGAYFWYSKLFNGTDVVSRPTEPDWKKVAAAEKPEGVINILLLGIDKDVEEIENECRADTIILVAANAKTHQVSLISIPRDTRVKIEGLGLTKINHANVLGSKKGGTSGGSLETAKAVSNLLGVSINYYVKIDFEGFVKAVNAVGGVDINLPYAIDDYSSHCKLPAGKQHIYGEDALKLIRTRWTVSHGDFDRQSFQYMIVSSIAKDVLSPSNIDKLPELVNIVDDYLLDTNLSVPKVLALGLAFKGITSSDFSYYQIPGHGIYAPDPLIGVKLYYFEPDVEQIKKIVQEATQQPSEP